ncbi:hypothetical protein [Streptomyces sp. NPDC057682]|uniref:hypothetical protein n=1 Tax=Streptomyces sp. NPDC057682 TaxID=3346210 RepID=UPI0036B7D0E3
MAEPSDELIKLCKAAAEAQTAATSQPYSQEAWAPWLQAAERFQRAVTAEAEATETNRVELEQAAKKAALHPENE